MTDNVLARYYNGRNVLSQGPPASGYDKLADLVSSATGFHRQGTTTNALARGLDLATLGMLTGAYDGGREIADTGRPGALAMALMPGAKVAAPAAQAATQATTKGIRAFHGSPHDFDRFDLSKIGTGEGAQAYGHGLYFAESEGVAKTYKTAGKPAAASDAVVRRFDEARSAGSDDAAKAYLGEKVQRATNQLDRELYGEALANFDALKGGRGRLYEVRINAEPDEFLDWDKPLSEQGEKIRGAFPNADPALTGDRAYRLATERQRVGQRTGDPLEDVLIDMPITDHRAAASRLREAGIPGIKYLDQGSRTAGEGSRNYVVFDDALIEIMRKYGLLPPLAAGGLGAVSQSDPAMASP